MQAVYSCFKTKPALCTLSPCPFWGKYLALKRSEETSMYERGLYLMFLFKCFSDFDVSLTYIYALCYVYLGNSCLNKEKHLSSFYIDKYIVTISSVQETYSTFPLQNSFISSVVAVSPFVNLHVI